ncbi:MAG TPA: NADH-quinone oxidoreductase subunit NuoE [bacterium]|nr:NADH-quinone oxidoreductase subunit NuoE [bacterium]
MKKQLDIEPVLQHYHRAERDALIPILQEVQAQLGYIPRDAVTRIARHLNLPASKVYGVATFYNQFRFNAPGLHQVQVCRGTACHVKGSQAVLEALERELSIKAGQTTKDGQFSLEIVACLGACGLAPVLTVDGEFHAGVLPEQVAGIIAGYRTQEARS